MARMTRSQPAADQACQPDRARRAIPAPLLAVFDAAVYRCACGAWCIGAEPCGTCIALALALLRTRAAPQSGQANRQQHAQTGSTTSANKDIQASILLSA